MLGRLIQTAASYGKGSAALESATEEAHTRNLLYGQSSQVYSLAQSPPSSPFAGPSFRPGTFDDRGGLELEERDLRILIAQDAFGAEEKPTLLFDSSAVTSSNASPASHTRHSSTVQVGARSPLPNDWRPGVLSPQAAPSPDSPLPFRNRSSTISGAPSAWTRPVRDAGTREEAFLECMFGVTSSTKAASTTKLHVMPANSKSSPQQHSRRSTTPDNIDQQNRRAPLQRARTSGIAARNQSSPLPALDTEPISQDAILVTRLFSVTLPEAIGTAATKAQADVSTNPIDRQPATPTSPADVSQQSKKPKLVERKVPAFAIGLILYMPRSSEIKPSTRPPSRSAHIHSLSSASSSFGSDIQASWTFLNAIPESLASSKSFTDDIDRRVETVVNNWDVVLRAISSLEREATAVIYEQLDRILNQAVGPTPKTPKEKAMQRINQRIVSITDPSAIARRKSLQQAARHAISRVSYALRIPRVVTGLGFFAGHWSEEARTLYRMCGGKQHNFFLFNLLTAFLGNHTQWLQRLAPDWYRKQFRASNKKRPEPHLLAQRTVIVADQRAIARRLVFILASFIPGSTGFDGLSKIGDEMPMLGHLSASSPTSNVTRNESLRRTANRRMRDYRLQSNTMDKVLLSTSASSADSIPPSIARDGPQRCLVRKDSDAVSIKAISMLPLPDADAHLRKTSAGTTSTVTPNASQTYFSKRDSYFPEGVIAEAQENSISADLAKILRRSSSSGAGSSNASSRWGSLMSGITDLWAVRQSQPRDLDNMPTHNSGGQGTHPLPSISDSFNPAVTSSSLQHSARESGGSERAKTVQSTHQRLPQNLPSPEEFTSPSRPSAAPPQLRVDDKDGVIDVDLDLPGFSGFQINDSLTSPSRRSHRPSVASGFDGSESVRSLRSIPTSSPKAPVTEDTSVAGYLRRHHEDFTLHAVRPYSELEQDIKRSMSMEPSPPSEWLNQVDAAQADGWTNVCTTLLADVRTYSLRRITLRRKLSPALTQFGSPISSHESNDRVRADRRPTWDKAEEEFLVEEIKDFDNMLADAIERVLNLAEALQPTSLRSPRIGHSRAASTSTTMTARSTLPEIPHEYARQDCRQVVIGALEEVVKDVNDDLSKLQKGRDIHGTRDFDTAVVKAEMKQENILREGVKRWLLNVEQSRVW